MYAAPGTPTIADLLGQRPAAPSTAAQQQASQMFQQRLDQIGGASSVPEALSDIGGHIANLILSRRNMTAAREADQQATQQEEQRRRSIAEMLAGSGYSPEQAVGFATGSPGDIGMVAQMMGMQQDQKAAADERDYRQATLGLQRDQFGLSERQLQAQQEQAAADRALRREMATQKEAPAGIRTIQGMGLDPRTPEGQDMLLRLQGREAAAAAMSGTDRGKFAEEMAKASVKEIGDLGDRTVNKQNQLRLIDQMEAAGPGAFAAPMAESKLDAARFARAIGLDVEGTTESEMLQSATNQMAMLLRNPDSGGGLPGAASDADRRFLVSSVPNLAQSPDGRAKLTQAMRTVTEDDIMRAEAKRQYLIDNRGSQDGWEAWAKQNMPPAPDIKSIIGAPSASGRAVGGKLTTPGGVTFEVVD